MHETKRPLKVFLCHAHIIPLRDADRNAVPQGDDMRALYTRLTKDILKRTPTRIRGQKRTPPAQIREFIVLYN